ncbi:MAG TPA: hypothetical protein VFE30_18925 [Anaeromyxobacteraceae bacterium]|jgi:hypothetical protein|nr:hypothetical protein [Anaeromyxobacteraceae bacterium]
MISLLKWLLVVGTLAALFALVPVGGRTLLERARVLRGGGGHHPRAAQLREGEDEAPEPPAAGRPAAPRSPAERSQRPMPRERHSPSDHAALDRLVDERAR